MSSKPPCEYTDEEDEFFDRWMASHPRADMGRLKPVRTANRGWRMRRRTGLEEVQP